MTDNNRREFMKTAAVTAVASMVALDATAQTPRKTASGYATGSFSAKDIDPNKEVRSSGIDGTGETLDKLNRPLRILVFGGHPDDAELKAGGVGAMLAARGHAVKFVSVTNGDMGYWKDTGASLAARRKAEVEHAAKILGNEVEVLDIGDGTLVPSLENRLKLIKVIREWKADIVMGHRPYDYQADHRYLGVLMQDTAFMAAVPGILPEIPAIPNPVYFYTYDTFKRPFPFIPDIAVGIDSVIEKKIHALDVMESQFYEGGCMANENTVPEDAEGQKNRHESVREYLRYRCAQAANIFREALIARYGKEKGEKIRYAEAFEICEYGRKITPEEIEFLFPTK